MRKIIAFWLVLALLLFFGAVMALAQEPELTQEEKLMQNILEIDKKLQEAMKNQQTEAVVLLNKQLKKAQEEYEEYLLKQEAIEDFGGLGFSVGAGITFFPAEDELIEEAEIINGIVRIKREGKAVSRMMLESHYFFILDNESNGKWGIGPFVGILTNEDQLLDAFGLGVMVGLRRLGESSSRSLNFGAGWVWDRNCKVLGDGIYANMLLPEGETEIRYKYKTLGGFIVIVSFSF